MAISFSSGTFDGVTFRNNTVTDSGGAIWDRDGSFNLRNCTFIDNSADEEGGGVDAIGPGAVHVDQCEFVGNSARIGGAIQVTLGDLMVRSTVFRGNTGDSDGGAIDFDSRGSLLT